MRKTEFYMMMALYSVVIGLAMHSKTVIAAGVVFVVAMVALDVLTAVPVFVFMMLRDIYRFIRRLIANE